MVLSKISYLCSKFNVGIMVNLLQNPLLLPDNELFSIGKSNLQGLENYHERSASGGFFLCRKGRAVLSIDDAEWPIRRYASILILPGSMVSIRERSEDFQLDCFVFSSQLFSEAAFRLDIEFLRILKHHPVNHHTAKMTKAFSAWFKILEYSYLDRENRFRDAIIRNRLQIALMEAYDKVLRKPEIHLEPIMASSRQSDLFSRFTQLVHQHVREEREVAFYAEKLCISTRYLSTIARTVSGHTAKELIDHTALIEIQMLLRNTDLSVQEIAYQLHFPDQSYLGRFFRKHTGLSPTAYRQMKK